VVHLGMPQCPGAPLPGLLLRQVASLGLHGVLLLTLGAHHHGQLTDATDLRGVQLRGMETKRVEMKTVTENGVIWGVLEVD